MSDIPSLINSFSENKSQSKDGIEDSVVRSLLCYFGSWSRFSLPPVGVLFHLSTRDTDCRYVGECDTWDTF